MNRIALYLASILVFQTTPTYNAPSAYAQEQKVSTTPQQKEKSVLEQLIDTLEIAASDKEKQKIIKTYNLKINYQSKYQEITDKIWNLPLVQYRNTHFLADNRNTYAAENIRIEVSDTYIDLKANATKSKPQPTMDLLLKYDQLEHQHWDPQQKKVVKQERIIKEFQPLIETNCSSESQCTYQLHLPNNITPTSNEVYYIATTSANTILTKLQIENKTWQKKPWKLPKAEYKAKEPIDQKTGEFIFYGEDWCKPCHEIADYLFEQKIPFQEKSQKDTPAQCRDQVPYILQESTCQAMGKPLIMNLIEKIYKN